MSSRAQRVAALLATAAVVGAVAAGLWLVGTPAQERLRRLDVHRVDALRGIAAAIDLYWTRQARLPDSLDELIAERGITLELEDPSSGLRYEYRALDAPLRALLGKPRYELCASFAAPSPAYGEPRRDFWAHGEGRQCFELAPEDVQR